MNHAASECTRASSLFSPVRVRAAILVAAIGVAFYLCWVMIGPFLAVITWAAALAMLAHPLHAGLERRTRPNAAALISVCLVAVVIVAPAVFVSQRPFAELSEPLRAHRQEQVGPNVLKAPKGQGRLVRFLLQFHQPLVYILPLSALATAALKGTVDGALSMGR